MLGRGGLCGCSPSLVSRPELFSVFPPLGPLGPTTVHGEPGVLAISSGILCGCRKSLSFHSSVIQGCSAGRTQSANGAT